mmetsp:Transcript_19816/g.55966  ORF Transcript_19816/g.55966 Transcript_19816/m.55966 type:complete len:396 (-) Transcript_19816:2089-3276(-)
MTSPRTRQSHPRKTDTAPQAFRSRTATSTLRATPKGNAKRKSTTQQPALIASPVAPVASLPLKSSAEQNEAIQTSPQHIISEAQHVRRRKKALGAGVKWQQRAANRTVTRSNRQTGDNRRQQHLLDSSSDQATNRLLPPHPHRSHCRPPLHPLLRRAKKWCSAAATTNMVSRVEEEDATTNHHTVIMIENNTKMRRAIVPTTKRATEPTSSTTTITITTATAETGQPHADRTTTTTTTKQPQKSWRCSSRRCGPTTCSSEEGPDPTTIPATSPSESWSGTGSASSRSRATPTRTRRGSPGRSWPRCTVAAGGSCGRWMRPLSTPSTASFPPVMAVPSSLMLRPNVPVLVVVVAVVHPRRVSLQQQQQPEGSGRLALTLVITRWSLNRSGVRRRRN